MTAGPAVVFLGPSLPADEAALLCPAAVVLPPAAQGDLLGAVLDRGASVVGLIDGVFDQSPSVWHKEVLYALAAGVSVVGAASMGALRAAELDVFGMRGVGEIYAGYSDGTIVDDDEVALCYGEIDGRYLRSSEPMVNIRASCAAAVRAGAASERLAALAVRLVKELHFSRRSYPRIRALLRDHGEPEPEIARLCAFLAEHAVDLKADDARALLRGIAGAEFTAGPPPRMRRTLAFDTLFRRDRRLGSGASAPCVDTVAERFRASAHDADAGVAAALDRGVLLMVGELLRVDPPADGVEAELDRWRGRHGLIDEAELGGWLRANRTSMVELRTLARGEAVVVALRHWLTGALATEGTAPLVLDHLRWQDWLTPYLEPVDPSTEES